MTILSNSRGNGGCIEAGWWGNVDEGDGLEERYRDWGIVWGGLWEVVWGGWLRLGVFRIRSATVSPAEIPAESPGIYPPRRRLFLYPTRAYAHKGYALSNLKQVYFCLVSSNMSMLQERNKKLRWIMANLEVYIAELFTSCGSGFRVFQGWYREDS